MDDPRGADAASMSRPRREWMQLHRPFQVTIGQGGLTPIVMLGALFAGIGARAGLSVFGAAVVGALGGTASLIAHELGHLRAARTVEGVRPVGVSLVWLGAATHLEGVYTSGRDRARVAIAGPRTSFALALMLVPVILLPIPFGVRNLVLLLVLFNVAVAAVNLIPVAPLDGHNLLVGLLWSMVGSESGARALIARLGLAWLGLEAVGTAILLLERPTVGFLVVAIAASLTVQKLLARRS